MPFIWMYRKALFAEKKVFDISFVIRGETSNTSQEKRDKRYLEKRNKIRISFMFSSGIIVLNKNF